MKNRSFWLAIALIWVVAGLSSCIVWVYPGVTVDTVHASPVDCRDADAPVRHCVIVSKTGRTECECLSRREYEDMRRQWCAQSQASVIYGCEKLGEPPDAKF